MHDQSGRAAQRVVERVAATILAVQDAVLRDELIRAMLSMLGDHLARIVQELLLKPLTLPENPVYHEIVTTLEARGETRGEARGEARGKADAMLRLLAARGVPVHDEARARILACSDIPTLDRWFGRAITATSVAVVLADN